MVAGVAGGLSQLLKGKDKGMMNAIVWIMVGMVAYLFYDHMVTRPTPESVPCDECNAGIAEPCRPYCIGLDSEDL